MLFERGPVAGGDFGAGLVESIERVGEQEHRVVAALRRPLHERRRVFTEPRSEIWTAAMGARGIFSRELVGQTRFEREIERDLHRQRRSCEKIGGGNGRYRARLLGSFGGHCFSFLRM